MAQIIDKQLHRKQLEAGYTKQIIEHYKKSAHVRRFIMRKATASKKSERTYRSRLSSFGYFIYSTADGVDIDSYIDKIVKGELDPYNVLADYAYFLVHDKKPKVSANHVRELVKAAKRLLKVSGVKQLHNEDFHDLVSLPRKESIEKRALEKIDVTSLLNASKNTWLQTCVMLLGCTGARPIEVCAVRLQDLQLDSQHPTVTFRKEYVKMRVGRTRRITKECAAKIKQWLTIKYDKPHHTTYHENGVPKWHWVVAERRQTDLLLAHWHYDGFTDVTPEGVYDTMRKAFADLIDIMGCYGREDGNQKRRSITMYSFRRFVKSTISDYASTDFSEWFIGHEVSTYYRKSEAEREQIYQKMEPYLTFLDYRTLDSKTKELGSQLDAVKSALYDEQKHNQRLETEMTDLRAFVVDKLGEKGHELMAK